MVHRKVTLLSVVFTVFFAGTSFAQLLAESDTARLAWARHYASGSAGDLPSAMAVDASGNVYVTGISYGPTSGADYTTVKYNSLGVEQWVVRFNGLANQHDIANGIAVDGSGHVYVTGRSTDSASGTASGYNYATIKYSPAGDRLWVARYNGAANNGDEASAIAVDSSGNVFVTGTSYGTGSSIDYVTIKYDASGVQQWVARYDGPANSWDLATAIAIDDNGYVYVTGSSYGMPAGEDYATVKYDPSGTEQWVARYRYPITPTSSRATGIALDGSGNVYVSGSSYGGPGVSTDFATVKYNSAGTEQWAMRYNGPGSDSDEAEALEVDSVGNVYVTGRSNGGTPTREDYATIKYSSSGVQLWVARYNGPASTWDRPTALALDRDGSVYVTGSSYGTTGIDDIATVKYNPAGVQQWVARHGGTGNDLATSVVLDRNGSAYVAGITSRPVTYADGDYTVIKYDPTGIEQWIAYYRGWDGSLAHANSIASDGSGGAYVSGWSQTYSGTDDYTTIRYDGQGTELWIQRYNGPANSVDRVSAMTVDLVGNVIVTGTSRDTTDDYATVKYNAAGTQQWVQRYNGPGNASDGASAIAADGLGNIIVAGSSTGSGSAEDYATVKYNLSGLQQWVVRYNGSANSNDQATAVAVDASGNAHVTGWSVGSTSMRDYATVKYDAAGQLQWVARYDGPGHMNDEPNAIAVDPGGDVYVTGRSTGLSTDYDCVTVKYDPSGLELWVARYSSEGSAFDEGKAVRVDSSGNVYVVGTVARLSYDCLLIKYTSSGAEEWVRLYDGPASGSDFADAVALGTEGSIYVGGTSDGIGTGTDMFIRRYEPSGAESWLTRFNEWGNPDDATTAIAVEPDGIIWSAGTSSFMSDQHIYTVLKYEQDQVVSVTEGEQLPSKTRLFQNFPNPFNPTTHLRFEVPGSGAVSLKVYDLLGREVATLVDEVRAAGNYEVRFDAAGFASGVYLYRLQAGDFVQTRTMLLLK